jgi:hypothetical protein
VEKTLEQVGSSLQAAATATELVAQGSGDRVVRERTWRETIARDFVARL